VSFHLFFFALSRDWRELMQRFGLVERFKLLLVLGTCALVGALVIGGARSSANSNTAATRGTAADAMRAKVEAPPNAVAAHAPVARGENSPAVAQAAAQTPTPAPGGEGCSSVYCHGNTEPMHMSADGKLSPDGKDGQGLSCSACHGGNPAARPTSDAADEKKRAQLEAHVRPRHPELWKYKGEMSSANPERINALMDQESWEFVRFVNPGDLRVTQKTCGGCHAQEVNANETSSMRHGAFLWGAALYNNGGFPYRDARYGESYSPDGYPERLIQVPQPTLEQQLQKGWLTWVDPIPRWEISQPGNVLRVFERGDKGRLDVGLPEKDEDPGKPRKGLSARGLGTAQRTDPVYLGLQKTRLLDPTLNHFGTNDHPGDFRSSGCTACHVIYANDRSKVNSGPYAEYGNMAYTTTGDKNIPRGEPGHPIRHTLTNAIPTSQCMVCHMHPGTNMVATYTGMIWWDNETDGDKLYRPDQHEASEDEKQYKLDRNPEAASLHGRWSEFKDPERVSPDDFLVTSGDPDGALNKSLKNTQLADYHGHGWLFRAVFKRDRAGNFTDSFGKPVKSITTAKLGRAVAYEDNDPTSSTTIGKSQQPVHLKDIHLEKGMHCVDCHFRQDSHGTGILYAEPRAAIEINCTDCHGSIQARVTKVVTSGFAAGQSNAGGQLIDADQGRDISKVNELYYRRPTDGRKLPVFQFAPDLAKDPKRTPLSKTYKDKDGKEQKVEFSHGEVIQNSIVEPGRWWRVKQTRDTIDPASSDYNPQSAYAKTIQRDNKTWGAVPGDEGQLAHPDKEMTCFACHSSWMTSCFGCHLSMKANKKMPNRHNEATESRNFTTYNFQVIRDDVFMLGKDGTTTGHRVAPVASRSAVIVSSQNQNREWIYSQQQTISAEGYSGQSFSTHVPHTVRAVETKGCSDCHVSEQNDNNAWMAQLMLQGTNFVNFMGRYVYVAAEEALEVVPVTEREEPQAVYGSTLHKLAYPDDYKKFVEKDKSELKDFYEHVGNPEVLSVQLRGEYAYVAAGEGGLRVYDVAQIDHKGFSERVSTAPVSRFGQRFWVKTKYATSVASPTTLGVDPARARDPINQEQPIHLLYAFLYVADKYEGLVLVNVATLLDGDPLNNYLKRALTWNPNGVLNGANNIMIAGTHAYITTDKALVIVDIDKPLEPQVVANIPLREPKAVAVQFRYAFVATEDGLQVVDITNPKDAHLVEGAEVKLNHAHDVYVARTYAYVADGADGIAIINVEKPEHPVLDQMFNAGGQLNDTHQVKVAMTNASLYAYVADGKNGLRILQLTDPETMPTYAGFSPRPQPRLIAWYKTKGPAIALSKGLDRDRAVDESGNQLAVFGRRGARPFNLEEMQRMYMIDGKLFTVTDTPATPAQPLKSAVNRPGAADDAAQAGTAVSLNSMLPLPHTRATQTIIGGGLGLFCAVFGVRRLRRRLKRS
jgi:predicted CxxxxCH...CXXCH cytochrome family protein